jgi:hypothetical protein
VYILILLILKYNGDDFIVEYCVGVEKIILVFILENRLPGSELG